MLSRKNEIWIALLCSVAAIVAAVVWVPLDSETPPVYTFRRQTYIGDAMLPMVAATGIGICAIIHLLLTLRRDPTEIPSVPRESHAGVFFLQLVVLMIVSCFLMYWAGPIALSLFDTSGKEAVTYRQMRTAFPWKYIGYGLGGFTMVFGITSLVEGRILARRALTSMLAVLALILVFDVPFDTILLPPNGDF